MKYKTLLAIALTLTFVAPLVYVKGDDDIRATVQTRAELNKEQVEAERARLRLLKEEAVQKMEMEREEAMKEREARLEARVEVKAEIEAKKEERKLVLEEKAKTRITANVEKVVEKLNAMVERIEKLNERVNSRIDKLIEMGVDVTNSVSLSAEVEVKIAVAKEAIMAIDTSAVVDSETPRETFEDVKLQIASAKQALREAHAALVEAVKSLKANVKVETETEVETENN